MQTIHSLWLTNGPTSKWVGPDPGLVNSPNGVYAYTNVFYLPCTNRASATGRWAGDDSGAIYLNGLPTGNILPNGWAFTNWSPVNITSGFVPGWNTMVFYVTNSGASPTGLRTEVTVAGVAAACCNNCLAIYCPSNLIVHICGNIQGEDQINYPAPNVINSCGGAVAVICTPPPGSVFP